MATTIAQSLFQEGFQIGEEKGRSEGRMDEAKRNLSRVATRRFGPPSDACVKKLAAIDTIERLEHLFERVIDVGTWDELLGDAN